MDATEDFAALLHTVTNNPAVAVWANWCQRMNRALETVEGVMLSGHNHFECLVILIFANFACSHT
jgi:hypothetical protein